MITQPQYLIAKYIPRNERNEPRNIGIVLWTPRGVLARFIAETKDGIDRRKIPSWIQYPDVLKEWVISWRRTFAKGCVFTKHGEKVQKEPPDSLNALADTSRGNYLLADHGLVLEDKGKTSIDSLLI